MASSANVDFVMLYLAGEEVGKLNSDIISRRLLSEFCDVCLLFISIFSSACEHNNVNIWF